MPRADGLHNCYVRVDNYTMSNNSDVQYINKLQEYYNVVIVKSYQSLDKAVYRYADTQIEYYKRTILSVQKP